MFFAVSCDTKTPEPKQFTVTFDTTAPSGTSGTPSIVQPQTVTENELVTEPTPPTLAGYVFGGWFEDLNSTNAYVFSKPVTADLVLHAMWIPQFAVTFDGNASQVGGGTILDLPSPEMVMQGSLATKPQAPTCTGYYFLGWYTDTACTTEYLFSEPITSDMTLYAKWEQGKTITFEENKPTGVSESVQDLPEPITVQNGTEATAPDLDPTLFGYTFEGWYTDDACSVPYDFSNPVNDDITLYAKWAPKTYTVTYDANAPSGTPSGIPGVQTIQKGMTLQEPADPTLTGYRFDGWYSEDTCTTKYDFSAPVMGDITLYAKWTKVSTVKFDTSNITQIDDMIGMPGEKLSLPLAYASGKDFLGWYEDSNFSSGSPVQLTSTFPTEDKTYYAKLVDMNNDIAYNTDETGDTVMGYTGTGTNVNLVIPYTHNGIQITKIGNEAFLENTKVAGVVIPEGVTSIGASAFYKCTNLTSITIPESVISIGEKAFGYSNLTSVTIPEGVTSIESMTFYYCHKLASITIPEGITSIGGYAFDQCNQLTSIKFPSSLETIGGHAFQFTGLAGTLTIPASVNSIGASAFSTCKSLTSITVDSANTHYKSYDGALYTYDGKTLLQVPTGKTGTFEFLPGVQTIEAEAFRVCANLDVPITIPDSVTTIGNYAFAYCTNLTTITIPENVTSIGYRTFQDCTNLTTITISSSVTSIANTAFDFCKNLTDINIKKSENSIPGYENKWGAPNPDAQINWNYNPTT